MSRIYGLKPLVGSLGNVSAAQDIGEWAAPTQRTEDKEEMVMLEKGWVSAKARKRRELLGYILFFNGFYFGLDVNN